MQDRHRVTRSERRNAVRSRFAQRPPLSEPLERRVHLSTTLETDQPASPLSPLAMAVLATTESIYLSDLTPSSAVSPYHGWKRDRSAAGEPMRIGGVAYDRGVGVHSPSSLVYNLGGEYTRFTSYVGIDDSVGNSSIDGSAEFQVWGDGVLLYTSPRLTGADAPHLVDVDITGVQQLRLVTTTGGLPGDNDYKDHANWADARLETGPSLPRVSISASASSTSESGGAFWTFTRTGDITEPLSVAYTVSGTATNGIDYSLLNGLITIPAGQSSWTLPLVVIDDNIQESNETVILTIQPNIAFTIGTASATITIIDNDTPAPPPPTQGEFVYLSDLNWTSAQSPYHSAQKDRAASGQPLRIGGVTYDKGVGVHSHSELVYNIGGQYARFTAQVGIDDYVGNGSSDGSAVFQVWGDGVLLAASRRLTGADSAELLDVDVTGVQQLRLVTTTGGDNDYKDHTNWADAKLYRNAEEQPPAAGHGLLAQYYDNEDFTNLVTTRIDQQIAIADGSPLAVTSPDTFSVRWTGLIDPPETGQYTFTLDVNQGARLWIGGELVIDAWESGKTGDSSLLVSGTANLVAGVKTPILLAYYELTGNQRLQMTWTRPGGTTQAIPTEHLLAPQPSAGQPVRIMLVGDSVTEAEKDHASYRFWLDRMLTSAGIDFDFVGSRSGVHNSFVGGANVQPIYPWFDQDHQSRWGATLNEVAGYPTPQADIAVIHIGHNDIRGGKTPQQMINDLSAYIDQLRAINPNIRIAIAQPIANFSLGWVAEMDQYRALIPGLAAAKSTAQSPVIVVDQYTGFDPQVHTYDTVHPNEAGERQIAERFFEAFRSLLA